MYLEKKIKAILLLAGKSERFSENALKQCQYLAGKKVYLHTLERFLEIPYFDEIILVCHSLCFEQVQTDICHLSNKVIAIKGGATRQESSYLGLKKCGSDTDFVVIHDAVRPLIDSNIIRENIYQVLEHHAVDTCIPTPDTIVKVNEDQKIHEIPNRAFLLRGQTPQSFAYPLIMKAHECAQKNAISNRSDDCQLVLELGHSIYPVLGDDGNIKITTELDLFLAEQILRLRKNYLTETIPKTSLLKKIFVVIGGTGGIGRAICELLEKEGAYPIALSRHSDPFSLDIGNYEQVETTFSRLYEKYGEMDGLINSAGILKVKQVEGLSSSEIYEMLQVNLHGVIFSCKSAKIKKQGHIVNIASSAYTRGRPHYAVYSCAKAAVVNFTQAFAEECPHLNVNAIIPHRTKTLLRTNNFSQDNEEELLSPYEVAHQIMDLLKYPKITGSIIEVRKNL